MTGQEKGYYEAWEAATAKAEALEDAGEMEEAYYVRGWAKHLYREYEIRRNERESTEV